MKDLDLDATIDAPNLDNALPGLGGTAKGLVKVRGTVEAPQLLADITANNLRWQELSIARVRIEGDVKSTDQIGGNGPARGAYLAAGREHQSGHAGGKGNESSTISSCACRASRSPGSCT